jgi:hypothetical protein
VLLLAVACAAALAACGGGSSSDTTTTAAPPSTSEAESTEGGSGNETPQPKGGSETGSEQQGEGGSESPEAEVSPNDRSAPFRTKGGDNSIQNYGGEASSEERAKATKTLSTYFSASSNGEWAKVCTVLSAKNVEQLELFAEKIPKVKKKSCAGVLETLNASVSSGRSPETMKGGVIALRRRGSISFALYHGVDGKSYAFPLTLEGGEWKMTSLGATPLSF